MSSSVEVGLPERLLGEMRSMLITQTSLICGPPPPLSPPCRPLAYSILADLVHHIRTYLSLPNLSVAVHVFSSNVHDDTLPVSIQTMSCKLLLNLVESIRIKAEQEPNVSV